MSDPHVSDNTDVGTTLILAHPLLSFLRPAFKQFFIVDCYGGFNSINWTCFIVDINTTNTDLPPDVWEIAGVVVGWNRKQSWDDFSFYSTAWNLNKTCLALFKVSFYCFILDSIVKPMSELLLLLMVTGWNHNEVFFKSEVVWLSHIRWLTWVASLTP